MFKRVQKEEADTIHQKEYVVMTSNHEKKGNHFIRATTFFAPCRARGTLLFLTRGAAGPECSSGFTPLGTGCCDCRKSPPTPLQQRHTSPAHHRPGQSPSNGLACPAPHPRGLKQKRSNGEDALRRYSALVFPIRRRTKRIKREKRKRRWHRPLSEGIYLIYLNQKRTNARMGR